MQRFLKFTLAILLIPMLLYSQPIITSFSPTSAKPGDAVTIAGTNFNTTTTNNVVFFGATRAIVTAATATSITTIVPSGATYAAITLLNTGSNLAAYSRANFTPVYNPAKTTITSTDFLAKQDFVTGASPYSVAMGDLDGDGKPDLVVINAFSDNISVYRNTSTSGSIGSSSFATKVDFATGALPISVAIGDLDGDGKPDLAVVNNGSNTVSVFRNTATSGTIGNGSFATKVDFTTSNGPRSVAIGDLDMDGKPDLVVANQTSNNVSVFRNTATTGSISGSSFATKVDFTTGNSPYSLAINDLDGDGKPDLAVANFSSNTVSVFRNTSTSGNIGSSSFAIKVNFDSGAAPYAVAIGDLDGDGKPDLAITNAGSNTVSVLRNTASSGSIGGGSFATKIDFATGTLPYSVAISDLNGDGKADLAVANYNSNTVSVLRNTATSGSIGSSSFATKVDFATGDRPYSLTVGDLDGDGKPDLTTANLIANTVSILRNAGNNDNLSALTISSGTLSPSFASATTAYTTSINNATTGVTVTPTTADANATIQVRLNGGTFATVTSGSASASLSLNVGSNTIDILVTAENATTNTYTITITVLPTITSFSPAAAKPGDTVTIIGANFNTIAANNIVFFGASRATVTAATAISITATVPIGATYAPITLLNTAAGLTASSKANFTPTYNPIKTDITSTSFLVRQDFATSSQPWTVAIGDLDGDGKPDLVVPSANSNTVSVYRNTSTSGSIVNSSFATKVDFATGNNPYAVAIGDLDGDGKPDLVVTNLISGSVSILRNTASSGSIGAASFANKVDFLIGVGTGPRGLAIGDLDGDGKPDLAVTNVSSQGVTILRNTASSGSINNSSFASRVDFATGINPISVAIGDLDGDGKPDLAVPNVNSNTVSILRNTANFGSISSGSFANKIDFTSGNGPCSVAIGDLDGDGKPDLAVTNISSSTVSVFRNTASSGNISSSSFATKIDFAADTNPYFVAIGDLDGDSKPDLAVANNVASTVSVLRNTATSGSFDSSSFGAKVDFVTGTNPRSVAIGDLDGDGKPDLVVSNFSSNSVSILRNSDISPGIITTTGTLNTFTTCLGTPSASQNMTVSGTALSDNVIVTAPTGFEVSISSGSGYGSSVALTQTSGTVASTTIYVRLTASVSGSFSGNIACTSIGANTKNLAVAGFVASINLSANAQTNISCFGGNNSAASINAVTGGTAPYTYNWTPGNPTGDGTASVTGLTAGTWTCTVTDANSCTASQTFNITQPSALIASAQSQTNISCNGGSNGAASVSVSGGVSAYSYNWSPGNPTGEGTATVTGLTAGTWTCTVTDANSCTATQTFNITQPSALIASAQSQTNISCNGGSNGVASVSVSGGTSAYSYNWTPGNPTGDGTASVTGLTAGIWTCTVTDENTCTTIQTFNVTQPSVQPDNVTNQFACESYTWLNNNQTYTQSGTYTGTTANCITEKLILTITASSDNITTVTACDSYTWNGITYTTSGIKTGTTTNCVTEKLNLTINNSITPTFTQVAPICSGSTIAALPTTSNNGITGTWSPALINLATTTYIFTPTAGLCASNTTLTITVNTIALPIAISPQIFPVNTTVSSLTATGSGIKWYNIASGGTALLSTSILTTGIYYVTQIINSCESARISVQVNIIDGEALNFDGDNDFITRPIVLSSIDNLSLEVKLKWDGPLGSPVRSQVILLNGNSANSGYALYIRPNNSLSILCGGVAFVQSTQALTVGTWQHLAAVRENGIWKLYLDGVSIAITNDTATPNLPAGTTIIGANGSSEFFKGTIDEVRLWKRALSQAEILNNMNCELAIGQNDLQAYYQFNQGTAGANNSTVTTLTDASGNGNSATLANFALLATTSNWVLPGGVTIGSTCAILGVDNFESFINVTAYPNPSSDVFSINSDLAASATIYDLLGKTIKTFKIIFGVTKFDLNGYSKGVYLLKITNNNQTKTIKLIKQ